jgi:hypothetical protein
MDRPGEETDDERGSGHAGVRLGHVDGDGRVGAGPGADRARNEGLQRTEMRDVLCDRREGQREGAADDVGSRLSADEIRDWMVNPAEMTKKTNAQRKPPMKAYTALSKEYLDAIVAYQLSLKKK